MIAAPKSRCAMSAYPNWIICSRKARGECQRVTQISECSLNVTHIKSYICTVVICLCQMAVYSKHSVEIGECGLKLTLCPSRDAAREISRSRARIYSQRRI